MSEATRKGRLPGDLSYFLREARRRPPVFLLRKTGSQINRWVRTGLAEIGLVPYRSRRTHWRPGSLGSLLPARDLDAALEALLSIRPEELDTIHAQGNRLAQGELEIFSRAVPTSRGIDWHSDFVSGRRWPTKFHGRFSYGDLLDHGHASDVKVPWELSRLQWLPILALAYRLDGSDLHLSSLIDTLSDWDRANPVGFGINWTIGMEVALRAVNLIWTSELLANTAGTERLKTTRLAPLLVEHGKFLARNVEYSDISGNHYTSCLLGLLYLGLYLPEEPEAATWVETGLVGLNREILAQTYADGVCHEGSIPYHRLVLELFLHGALLCRRHGLSIGATQMRRLERMVEFTAAYTKPSGLAPVWGDTDDGRVLRLGSQSMNDHRYLLTLGGLLLGRTDLMARAGPLSLDAILLADRDLLQNLEITSNPPSGTSHKQSQGFPEGGFFILRSSDNYCLVDCGDVGLRGRGGHGHNDALSIEVSLGGIDILTDSGSSSYTRSIEDRLRTISARSHNVTTINDQEPAPISLDRLPHATALPVHLLRWDPEQPRFTGRHLGFSEIETVEFYERRLEFLDAGTRLSIEDRIVGNGRHRLTWRFHFAERWDEAQIEPNGVQLRASGSRHVELRWKGPSDIEVRIADEVYHPTYDGHRTRKVLTLEAEEHLPAIGWFDLRIL